MADIFVSYASEDHARVAPIVRILESLGWSVWWDAKLSAGNEFDEVISHQLAESRCVLVIWTRHSVQSRWVRGEAREGLERSKAVPLLLDDVAVPIDFRAVHFANLSKWRGDPVGREILEMRNAVSSVLSNPPNPEGPSTLKRERVVRFTVTPGRVAMIALAAMIVVFAFEFGEIVHSVQLLSPITYALRSHAPFSESFLRAFNGYRTFLEPTIETELRNVWKQTPPDTWSASQLLLASELKPSDEQQAFVFYDDAYDKECHCWGTFDKLRQVAASAWVVLAHARSGRTVPREVIDKFIKTQSDRGGWPAFFDADKDEASASGYATALVMLALHEYRLKSPARGGKESADIADAIEKAGGWLFANHPASGQLWVDYPSVKGDVTPSRGVSALVTSAFLTVFKDDRAKTLFSDWFIGLKPPVDLVEFETAKTQVKRAGFWQRDSTRYLIVGWELAALSQGYPWLGWHERISAQEYLFDVESRLAVARKAGHNDFFLGETLVAFRYAAAGAGIDSVNAPKSRP